MILKVQGPTCDQVSNGGLSLPLSLQSLPLPL